MNTPKLSKLVITEDEEEVIFEMIKYFNDKGWINDYTQKRYESLCDKVCNLEGITFDDIHNNHK